MFPQTRIKLLIHLKPKQWLSIRCKCKKAWPQRKRRRRPSTEALSRKPSSRAPERRQGGRRSAELLSLLPELERQAKELAIRDRAAHVAGLCKFDDTFIHKLVAITIVFFDVHRKEALPKKIVEIVSEDVEDLADEFVSRFHGSLISESMPPLNESLDKKVISTKLLRSVSCSAVNCTP